MTPTLFSLASTVTFALVMILAAVWDLRERRIPNHLTVAGIALALLIRLASPEMSVEGGVVGGLLAFGITVPFFAASALGGGDVKLLTAVGAFLGPAGLASALLLTGLVGALIALVVSARQKVIVAALLNCRDLLVHVLSAGRAGERRTLSSAGIPSVPYGIAIALGGLGAWFVPVFEVLP